MQQLLVREIVTVVPWRQVAFLKTYVRTFVVHLCVNVLRIKIRKLGILRMYVERIFHCMNEGYLQYVVSFKLISRKRDDQE